MRLDAPPLTPDPGTARRWLGGELARPAYADRQTWWQIVRDWLGRHVPGDGSLPGGTPTAVVVVLLLLALVGVILVRSVQRWRSGPTSTTAAPSLFAEAALTAGAHRRRAQEALAHGDTQVATQEAFRALVRGLQDRTILPDRDGLTATEVAVWAGPVLPEHRAALGDAAALFNAVSYGDAVPSHHDAAALVELEARVAAARPADLTAAAR